MIWKALHCFFMAKLLINPKRILVIREAAIGDVICMTPFLKQLQKKYPSSQIDYVVVGWAKNVIETNPNIDNILVIPNDCVSGKVWKVALKRLWYYFGLAKRKYDLIFCPSTQLLYKLPLIFFRKSYKIGFSTESKGQITKHNFMLDDYVWIDLNELPRTRHIASRNLEMLDLISEKPVSRDDGLEIFLSDAEQRAVDKLFERLGIASSDELIAIAAAAGSAVKSDSFIKTAPLEKFIEMIGRLMQNNPNRKFFCIGASSERSYVEKMQICDEHRIFNLCGALSLRESAELLRRCKLLISNDSGATHLASALQMPHIVFFGATDDVEFGPYQNVNSTVYRVSLSCSPCRDSSCNVDMREIFQNHSRPFCLSMIDVNQVVDLAEQKLSGLRTSTNYAQLVRDYV